MKKQNKQLRSNKIHQIIQAVKSNINIDQLITELENQEQARALQEEAENQSRVKQELQNTKRDLI